MRRPLVLLHGFTGAPAAWDDVLARLDSGREVVRPALLGHAPERVDTELADPPASFDDAVDRLAAQLRSAGVRGGAHLCGYSLGGRMALGLLDRHRPLFAAATLVSANPGIDDGARAARAEGDERWAAMAEQQGLEAFLTAWGAQPLFATQQSLDGASLEAQRRWRGGHRAEGLALSLRCTGLSRMPSYWAMLPDLDLPVHLVVGEKDAKFRALAERANAALPRSVLSIVPDCGHNVPLEAPAATAGLLAEV